MHLWKFRLPSKDSCVLASRKEITVFLLRIFELHGVIWLREWYVQCSELLFALNLMINQNLDAVPKIIRVLRSQ